MKKDFTIPILALSLICLTMSLALALVNNITFPLITDAADARAEQARRDILPQADHFILLENLSLPPTITEAYSTANNSGYIFIITARGYGGDFNIICAINPEGQIINSSVLPPHNETPGLGTVVFDRANEYIGKTDATITEVDTITGSTITFNAYHQALEDALTAFSIINV